MKEMEVIMNKTEFIPHLNKETQMRDAVLQRLYDLSEKEKDTRICLLTADMGAKAMDQWVERERETQNGKFSELGIAEAGMAAVAAGMAKEGFRPFIYSIANFNTKRILEHHILNAGIQNLPYVTIGVGTGYSYADSGPTHYMLEDISIMRTVPNLEILSPSDSIMAAELTEIIAEKNHPSYMRLERSILPINYQPEDSFEDGFKELREGKDTVIISTGSMVSRALEVEKELEKKGTKVGVLDIYRLKPLNEKGIVETLKNYRQAVTIEEHLLAGGLGSIIAETIVDNNLSTKLKRIGVPEGHPYVYGRENIHRKFFLDTDSLVKRIENL